MQILLKAQVLIKSHRLNTSKTSYSNTAVLTLEELQLPIRDDYALILCLLQNCPRRDNTIHPTGFLEMTISAPLRYIRLLSLSLAKHLTGLEGHESHNRLVYLVKQAVNCKSRLENYVNLLSFQSCLRRLYTNPKGTVYIGNDIETFGPC